MNLKYFKNLIYFFIVIQFSIPQILFADNPLTPQKLFTPRDSIKIFINSMNEYKLGLENNDESKLNSLNKAIKCLNLKEIPPLLKDEKGIEVAIFLKEILDRVYVFQENFEDVPNDSNLSFWVVPDTEITISLAESDGKKEFLFNSNTVINSGDFYSKVKHLPYLPNSGKGAGYNSPWKDKYIPTWVSTDIFGLQLWQWFGIVIAIGIGLIIKYLSKFFFNYLLTISKKTSLQWDDKVFEVVGNPGGKMFAIGFWYFFLYVADIDGKIYTILSYILKVFLGFYFILFLNGLAEVLGNIYKYRVSISSEPSEKHLVPLLTKITKILFVSLGIMLSLQNLGVNVISLLAGLGIGGLAIALAARDTAANLFGSLMILLDKPFKTGDQIIIGGIEGFVEEIGFRSTQIRSLNDSLVSIPNSVIANSSIDNLGMRNSKRTNFSFYISYDTNPFLLEAFLEGIKNIIYAKNNILKNDMVVVLNKLSDPGLEIFINFYSNIDTWQENLEQRQEVYLEIWRLAENLNIKFVTQGVTYSPSESNKLLNEENLDIEQLKKIAQQFGKEGNKSRPSGMGIYTSPYKERN